MVPTPRQRPAHLRPAEHSPASYLDDANEQINLLFETSLHDKGDS